LEKPRLENALLGEEDRPQCFPRIAHLEGEMGSLQTVLPFKLGATDEALTAHGGLALIGEYVRAMSICSLIDHELPQRLRDGGAWNTMSRPGHSCGVWRNLSGLCGCYGCYGPMETPNTLSLSDGLHKLGMDERGLMQVYRTFNANAGAFREESDRHDG
jgi:hypothetical protein